jgi:hypothetical protein
VPAGFTAVLRDATFFNPDVVLSFVASVVMTPPDATVIQFDVAPRDNEHFEGRIVFNAGDTMTVSTFGSVDVVLSGYLLAAS